MQEQIAALADSYYRSGISGSKRLPVRFLELGADAPEDIGGARVTAFPVHHAPALVSYGLRVEMDGKTVVYSGDTEWFDGLVEASRGADLMLLECTYLDEDGGYHVRLSDVLDDNRREDNERKNQVVQFMNHNDLDEGFRERVLEFMYFRATSASRRSFDPNDPVRTLL